MKIQFPVGDWSDDGHGKCEYFTVESNVPVDQLREAHFAAEEKIGINIGHICSDYEDSVIDDEVLVKLQPFIGAKLYERVKDYVDPSDMVKIWIACLMQVDPTIKLEIVDEESLPSINFYGHDAKGRHLSTPGYGLFE